MELEYFISIFSKIEKLPLPGKYAHRSMTSPRRAVQLATENLTTKTPKKAAVLALCYPDEFNRIHLLLIKRKSIKGDVHSAQIGFPGGSVASDDHSLLHTALREAEEEVGILRDDIDQIMKLSELYIPPSNFLVQPFFGIAKQPPNFKIQEGEVDYILEVPLMYFLDDVNISTHTISNSYLTNIDFPAFIYNQEVIWGATAMMIGEIRTLIKQII